ncbi:MAG TPA: hypothetical protein PKD85_08170 [Saprospiraceae bacterium]|nr:hypothetical protein [Saprospiraceae bacterium]
MAVSELKNRVKNRLDTVTDEYLLEEILNLIDFGSDKEEIFIIPSDHERELENSLEQMRNGETMSNEEVEAKIKKWLSE